jgi:hypothetical protein
MEYHSSANWMRACKNEGEDSFVRQVVESCSTFAIELGSEYSNSEKICRRNKNIPLRKQLRQNGDYFSR